jgi:hypothetical protein
VVALPAHGGRCENPVSTTISRPSPRISQTKKSSGIGPSCGSPPMKFSEGPPRVVRVLDRVEPHTSVAHVILIRAIFSLPT